MDAKKKSFIEAIHNSFGNISKACQACKVSRPTFYKWMKEDITFKEHVENIEEYVIDIVESELHKQIKEGNTTATIFFLKTKAKHRGYVERSEVQHDIQNTPLFTIDPLANVEDASNDSTKEDSST